MSGDIIFLSVSVNGNPKLRERRGCGVECQSGMLSDIMYMDI